jgi:hypothetical protein
VLCAVPSPCCRHLVRHHTQPGPSAGHGHDSSKCPPSGTALTELRVWTVPRMPVVLHALVHTQGQLGFCCEQQLPAAVPGPRQQAGVYYSVCQPCWTQNYKLPVAHVPCIALPSCRSGSPPFPISTRARPLASMHTMVSSSNTAGQAPSVCAALVTSHNPTAVALQSCNDAPPALFSPLKVSAAHPGTIF